MSHPAAISSEMLRQALLGLGRRGVLAAALNRDRFDLRRVARRCRAPVLLVNGAEDRFSPVPDVKALAAEMH